MSWILSNWRLILGGFALLSCSIGGFYVGMHHVQGRWDHEKAIFQAQLLAAQQAVMDKTHQQNIITQQVSHDYENKIATLRARYDALVKLRNTQSTANHLSSISNTTAGYSSTASTNGFSGRVADDSVGQLMLQADLQTQQLLACQGWIVQQAAN